MSSWFLYARTSSKIKVDFLTFSGIPRNIKSNEIQVNKCYWTKIGNDTIAVSVTGMELEDGKPVFRCVRTDTGKELPKLRSARALHQIG